MDWLPLDISVSHSFAPLLDCLTYSSMLRHVRLQANHLYAQGTVLAHAPFFLLTNSHSLVQKTTTRYIQSVRISPRLI